MKYPKLLTFILTLIFLSGCSVGRVNERLDEEDLIYDVKKIRDAQSQFRQKYKRYGTTEELVKDGFVEEKFEDNEELGYKFILVVDKDHYKLTVIPKSNVEALEKGQEQLSLYLDESGIIRASVNPKVPANVNSDSIAHQ